MNSSLKGSEGIANELKVINIDEVSNETKFEQSTKVVVIVVDSRGHDWEDRLQSFVLMLKNGNIFVMAVFIASPYASSVDNAMIANIDSWMVVPSREEARAVTSHLKTITDNRVLSNIEVNDIKSTLDGNKLAWFTTGVANDGKLSVAINQADEHIDDNGVDIKSFDKYLITIEDNSRLGMNHLSALNEFLDNLSATGIIDIKWRFCRVPTMPDGVIRITILAA